MVSTLLSPNGIKAKRFQDPAEDGVQAERWLKLTYDFAVHGGAVGTINLGVDPQLYNSTLNNGGAATSGMVAPATGQRLTDFVLPVGAIVREAFYDVVTPLASGGAATIALSTGETAGDLLAATAITTAGTAGIKDCTPNGTAANSKKTTAQRSPTLVIGTAALTSGKLVLHIRYTVSF